MLRVENERDATQTCSRERATPQHRPRKYARYDARALPARPPETNGSSSPG
jgi:hypothetical protein